MNAEGNKMGASFAHTRHTEKRRWAPFAISTKAKCERRKSNFQGTIQNLFSSMGLFSIESLSNKGSPPFAYLASMRREHCKIYAGRLKCNEWDSATPCQHRFLHHFTFDIGLFFSPLLSGGDDDDDEKKNAPRHTGVKWRVVWLCGRIRRKRVSHPKRYCSHCVRNAFQLRLHLLFDAITCCTWMCRAHCEYDIKCIERYKTHINAIIR